MVTPVNILVILGYPANNDGYPSPILKSRLDKGLEIYEQEPIDKIILTGGPVYNNFVEAEVMAVYCIEHGVPTDKIVMEPSAKNTYENARMVNRLIEDEGYTNVIIVTSAFHARRAKHFFSKHIDKTRIVTAPFPKKYPWFKKLFYTLKEYLILLLYNLGLLNKRYAIR